MALITHTCSSRGASVTFTIDDVVGRVTLVEATSPARQMRIAVFNDQGGLEREINPTRNTTSGVIVDLPARLVEIVKSDLSTKSYVCPIFAVFF